MMYGHGPCQVGLALQACHLGVANERRAAVDVTPEAAAMFAQFWRAHAACPLLGRNKVRAGVGAGTRTRLCMPRWQREVRSVL